MPKFIATPEGFKPRFRIKNPHKLNWGCVTVSRNGKLMTACGFWTNACRRNFVIHCNRMVLNRKNKSDRYIVKVHYGKRANEFISSK